MKGDAMSKPLIRSVPFLLTRSATDAGDGLTLEGYAAVFDSPTRIDSWEGTFDESIARGAFKKSINEKTPVLQFDHGRHASIGSIPIGAIETLSEDKQGLYVKARMHDNTLIQPVRDAIASGAIDGMSFRFMVVKDEWRDGKGNLITDPVDIERLLYRPDSSGVLQRTLKEVKVPELGPVVFPAYADTSVSVRDIAETLHDPQARAELARLLNLGTSPTSGGREGRPDDEEAANRTEEPGDHSEEISDATRAAAAAARHRALLLAGVIHA